MKVIYLATILAASLFVTESAEVTAETGGELFGHCSAAENNHWERGLCASNIGIVVETLIALKKEVRENSPLTNFCPAEDIPEEQIIEAVTDWLRENPQEHYSDASILVMVAIAETWPCAE